MAAVLESNFDIEKAIANFVADAAQTSLELPHMTTGQRKHAKRVAEKFSELSCESYGFGQDRQLHLFKTGANKKGGAITATSKDANNDAMMLSGLQQPRLLEKVPELSLSANAGCAVSVKNTFIDDWVGSEGKQAGAEAPVMRSMPPQLNKNVLLAALEEEESAAAMYILQDQKPTMPALKSFYASPAPSTAATSCDPSGSPISPAVSDLEPRSGMAPPPFSLAAAVPAPSHSMPPLPAASSIAIAPPPGLSVRNTFIHIDAPEASDERVVQSMPHDMFRKCLLEEVLQNLNSRAAGKVSATPAYDAAVATALSTRAPSHQSAASSHSATSTPPLPPAVATPFPAPAGYPVPPGVLPQQLPPAKFVNVQPPMMGAFEPAASLAPGSEVIIEGLSKMPAFNGLRGIVQALDEETGRYTIALACATATGHKTAKLKAENLKPVLPLEPVVPSRLPSHEAAFPCMGPPPPLMGEPCLSTSGFAAPTLMSTSAPWGGAMPDAGDRAAVPQALQLTALV